MARASAETLQVLLPLLVELRKIPNLIETKPGIFYIKRLPMLHFHETDDGIVADLKCVAPRPGGFDRFDVNSGSERRKLLAETQLRCLQLQKKTAL